MKRVVGAGDGEPRSLGVWLAPQSRDNVRSTVGKTGDRIRCCCNHTECADFSRKAWCQRLFVLRSVCDDVVGCTTDTCTLECGGTPFKTIVSFSLARRSCEDFDDFSFRFIYSGRSEVESVVVLLLAEGEPPITQDELDVWNAQGILGAVKMMRATCCLFRAQESVYRLLEFYNRYAIECNGSLDEHCLVYRLWAEAKDALRRACGDTDVKETEVLGTPMCQKCISCDEDVESPRE